MSQQEFKAFVEKYSRRYGRVRDMMERTERPAAGKPGEFKLPGSGELQEGRGADSDLSTADSGGKVDKDDIRELYEPPAGDVDPKYRKHVEDFFRAVSESAEPAPTTAPSE